MTKAKSVLRGASWLYSSQLATVLVQFAYAAITSRLINASGFGAYAIALSASAFVSLIANGGLSKTVTRIQDFKPKVVQSLQTFALILGASGAILLFFTADFWANFWGTPAAAAPIRWASIFTLIGPILGLSMGVYQRLGRYKFIALATLFLNIFGMLLGAFAVYLFRTPSSLLISAIVAQAGLAITLCLGSRKYLFGLASLKQSGGHLGFSTRVIFANMGAYIVGNISNWTAARFFGSQYLGQWNRADTVTRIPFAQIQSAIISAVSTQFRHDIDNPPRANRVWSDLLCMLAWVILPAVAIGIAIVPKIIPILFGPGWSLATAISIPLVAIGGVQILTTTLSVALEALAWFKPIWIGQIIQAFFVAGFSLLSILNQNFWLLILGILLGLITQHIFQIVAAHRREYLNIAVVARGYLTASMVSMFIWLSMYFLTEGIIHYESSNWALFVGIAGLVLLSFISFLLRKWLPPLMIAKRYGILK